MNRLTQRSLATFVAVSGLLTIPAAFAADKISRSYTSTVSMDHACDQAKYSAWAAADNECYRRDPTSLQTSTFRVVTKQTSQPTTTTYACTTHCEYTCY